MAPGLYRRRMRPAGSDEARDNPIADGSDDQRDQWDGRALPKGVMVVGMHRGGTSAVAGALCGAGFSLGGQDAMPAHDENPLGFFELESTAAINDRLLAAAGGSWDHPPPSDAVAAISDLANSTLGPRVDQLAREASPAPLVVKDPRTSVLIGVWAPLIGPVLRPTAVIRNPFETALSLASRDGFSIAAGLALWEFNWTSLLQGLEDQAVYVVRYEQLLTDKSVLTGLLQWTQDVLPSPLAARVQPDTTFPIRSDLRRSRGSDSDFRDFATCSQVQLWKYLSELDSGEIRFKSPPDLRQIGSGSLVTLRRDAEARRAVRAAHEQIETLSARERDLEATIAKLRDAVEDQSREATDLQVVVESMRATHAAAEEALSEQHLRFEHLLEEAERAAEQARASSVCTHGRLVATVAELEAMRASQAWRIGSFVTRSARRLRRLIPKAGAG